MKYKIVTTSIHSHSITQVQQMINAGANVLRYNAAYGSQEEITSHIASIRAWAKSNNKTISIMIDIPGSKPRIRINRKDGLSISSGDLVKVSKLTNPSDDRVIYLDNDLLLEDVIPGDVFLIDDGAIGLQVVENNGNEITTRVINAGTILPNKGIWVKDHGKPAIFITTKEIKKYIELIKTNKPEWVAISFATGTIMSEVKKLFKLKLSSDHQPRIAAKIETPEGVDTLDKITSYCEMFIVARGDLAELCDYAKLGNLQETIIRHGKAHNTPVIVATQILDSTTNSYLPSRAEILDLYYIFKEKADGVMLADAVVRAKNPSHPLIIISELESKYEAN